IFKSGGTIQVYYDDANGVRKPVLPTSYTLTKDLPNDETIDITMNISESMFNDMATKKLIVVYSGVIGSEPSVSVATTEITEDLNYFKAPGGLFTAQLNWGETAVDIKMANSLMSEESNGCGVTAIGSGDLTLHDVYPGTYAIGASAEGYEDLDDNISDAISLYVTAVKARKTEQIVINNKYLYANLGKSGHIADIFITRPEPNEPPQVEVIPTIPSTSSSSNYGGSSSYSTPHYSFSSPGYTSGRSSHTSTTVNNPPMCSSDSCHCLPCKYEILSYLNQSRLGPISGADVKLYKASQENDVNRELLYEGKTFTSSKIDEAGVINLPVPYPQQTTYSLEEQALLDAIADYDGDFILEVSGGFDIDADDNFEVDSSFTQVNGKLHLILSKQRLLQNDYKVNILTEIAYQLSQDLLGSNYDKVRLQTRLDDIASRVLIEKLYPSADQPLGRDDLFYWLPMAHKDWLVKPYDETLKPIVDKIYAGEDIYDDAYDYVYRQLAVEFSSVPIVKSQWFKVDENITSGSLIGEIGVASEGKSSVKSYSLSGSDKFHIDNEGKVYLEDNATLDYETTTNYQLTLKATNDEGDSKPVTLYVVLQNILDAPEDTGFSGGVISEDAQSGTEAGKISFNEGATPIERIVIGGADKDSFTIDMDGTIRVSDNAKFDYESKLSAKITLQAFNSLGGSRVVNITFGITDAVDIPIVQTLDTHLKEDATVGQEVGVVTILSNDPLLSVELSGSGSENFEIDIDGVLRVSNSATLDYESRMNFVLQLQAINIQGKSRAGTIVIRIDNVADVVELEKTVLRMIERSDTSTEIGQIKVKQEGASPITGYRLIGSASDKFSIDSSGMINVIDNSISQTNQEYFNLFVVAINDEGESLKQRLIIYIDTRRPILGVLNTYVYEDATSNTSLGVVPLQSSPTPITNIRLEGSGADNFTIDTNRELKVASGAILDYEALVNYTLRVIATNEVGDSDAKSIYVRVVDKDDTIKIKGFSTSISESIAPNTTIGLVSTLSLGGKTIQSYELSGSGSENFSIDDSGIVTISNSAVFNNVNSPRYHMALVAVDTQGIKSKAVYIDINVVADMNEIAKVSDANIKIKEDVGAGTVVGRVVVESKKYIVEQMWLSGTGYEKFIINTDGTIKLNQEVDYENIQKYNLSVFARNALGISSGATLHVDIEDINEAPIFTSSNNVSQPENQTSAITLSATDEDGDSLVY
ncbi:MAG: hypothetical protein DRG27_03950, partial [Deltaproteobacteria bacterium]